MRLLLFGTIAKYIIRDESCPTAADVIIKSKHAIQYENNKKSKNSVDCFACMTMFCCCYCCSLFCLSTRDVFARKIIDQLNYLRLYWLMLVSLTLKWNKSMFGFRWAIRIRKTKSFELCWTVAHPPIISRMKWRKKCQE